MFFKTIQNTNEQSSMLKKNNFKLLSFLQLIPEERLSPEPRVEWEESGPYTWIPNTIRCFTSTLFYPLLLNYFNIQINT
jgi:hypothetical protein